MKTRYILADGDWNYLSNPECVCTDAPQFYECSTLRGIKKLIKEASYGLDFPEEAIVVLKELRQEVKV